MRAAPGFAPRAIARLSRRIDIPDPSTAVRVAKNNEGRVNPGPWRCFSGGRKGTQGALPKASSVVRMQPIRVPLVAGEHAMPPETYLFGMFAGLVALAVWTAWKRSLQEKQSLQGKQSLQ